MNIKRILAAVLSICMILSVVVVPTFAEADANANVAFTVSATALDCDDTLTVEISLTKRVTKGDITGSLAFNADVLELTDVAVNEDLEDSADAAVVITTEEKDGAFDFSFTAPAQPAAVYPAVIATLTFTAKNPGDATLTLNEESTVFSDFVGVAQTEAVEVAHDFAEIILDADANLVSAADCENAAVYNKACSVCGELSDETFEFGAELGHDFATTYTYDDDNHWYDCSRCDVDDATAPHAHNTQLKNADGHWTKCVCGHETELVAHTASPWIYDVRPTMDKEGHRYQECVDCDYIVASESITAEDFSVEVITYVIVASASEGGSISPADKTYVLEGDSVVYNFYPEVGYEVAYVMVNGAYLGKLDSYTFANVSNNSSIYVVYKEVVTYDDGYVETPEIVVPEAPTAPEASESLVAVAAAKLEELKAVSTEGCSADSVAVFEVAVLALELAIEDGASDDEIINLVANAYLAKANLVVDNADTCDD